MYDYDQFDKVVSRIFYRLKGDIAWQAIADQLLKHMQEPDLDVHWKHVMQDVVILYSGRSFPRTVELAVFL